MQQCSMFPCKPEIAFDVKYTSPRSQTGRGRRLADEAPRQSAPPLHLHQIRRCPRCCAAASPPQQTAALQAHQYPHPRHRQCRFHHHCCRCLLRLAATATGGSCGDLLVPNSLQEPSDCAQQGVRVLHRAAGHFVGGWTTFSGHATRNCLVWANLDW